METLPSAPPVCMPVDENDYDCPYLLNEPCAPQKVQQLPPCAKETHFLYHPLAIVNPAVVEFLRTVVLYMRQRDRIVSTRKTVREREVRALTPKPCAETQASFLMSAVHFRIKTLLAHDTIDVAEFYRTCMDINRLVNEVAEAMRK